MRHKPSISQSCDPILDQLVFCRNVIDQMSLHCIVFSCLCTCLLYVNARVDVMNKYPLSETYNV